MSEVLITDASVITALRGELDAHYAPLAASDVITLTSGALALSAGSPTLVSMPNSRGGAWVFDASSNEAVFGAVTIPPNWSTMTVTVVWGNTASSSGDVSWAIYPDSMAAGSVLTGQPPINTVTGAAGAAGVVVESTSSAIAVPNPGGLNRIIVYRFATAASDTLANDAAMWAIVLTRAT